MNRLATTEDIVILKIKLNEYISVQIHVYMPNVYCISVVFPSYLFLLRALKYYELLKIVLILLYSASFSSSPFSAGKTKIKIQVDTGFLY